MRKKIYILALLIVNVLAIHAQSLREQIAKKEIIKKEEVSSITTSRKNPDTVYCISTLKQYGWFKPYKSVTLDYARKHGHYYMFTQKNAKGHWTHMETMNGYGKRVWNGLRPYILSNSNDPLGDKEWVKKVETACVFDFIADPYGDNVVQERAYDKDMNIVYIFSRTPIGEGVYIGSYKDYLGLPAEMRLDTLDLYTYGTEVIVTEDQWGNDSIIEFVDAKGVVKNTYDGSGKLIYIHDKKGRVVAFGSADHNGEFMMDDWGNCGYKYTYNSNDNFYSEGICTDNNGNPMRMPDLRGTSSNHKNVLKTKVKYDKYMRTIEESFYDIYDKPDTNAYGAHRIMVEYDDYGNSISIEGRDLKGNLIAWDNEIGVAKLVAEYDSLGRITHNMWFDKNMQLFSADGYLCEIEEKFGADGYWDKCVKFGIVNGKKDTLYFYSRMPNCRYEKIVGEYIKIDSLDNRGRSIATIYYDDKGNRLFNKEEGFHKQITQYDDMKDHSITQTINVDENLNLCGEYPYNIYIMDSITRIQQNINYDNQGNLFSTCVQLRDSTYNLILSQFDCNEFGRKCRAGGSSSVRLYEAKVMYNNSGKTPFNALIGRDEFDEPDYISSILDNGEGVIYYYTSYSKNMGSIMYDENNNPISNCAEFKDKCPKAMSIEVTDSLAYQLGLLDNDIILKYGDSYQMEDSVDYLQFIGDWSYAQMLEASDKKEVLVFRVNPQTKEYGVKKLLLPKGSPSNLGFIAHPIFRTQKQRNRQIEALKNYQRTCIDRGEVCIWNSDVKYKTRDKQIVIAFPEMFRQYRFREYPQQVIDPSVILHVQVPGINKTWNFAKDKTIEKCADVISSSITNDGVLHRNMCFTKDGKNVIQCTFKAERSWFRFFIYHVTNEQYNKLLKLSKNLK